MMTERVARLGLCIETGSDADAAELAGLAVDLREQLLELDIERADPATAGQAPPGRRSVKLEIDGDVLEVTGITRRDQRELIQAWIDRHADR
jgi:hypothetical protein